MVKTHGFPVKMFPSTNPLILSLKQIYSHIHPHSWIPIIPVVLFAASLGYIRRLALLKCLWQRNLKVGGYRYILVDGFNYVFNFQYWLVVTGTMEFWMTFHSVGNGMSSSQLTKSIIFQRGRAKNHQPEMAWDDDPRSAVSVVISGKHSQFAIELENGPLK